MLRSFGIGTCSDNLYLAHVLVGEPASIRDQAGSKLSPEHALLGGSALPASSTHVGIVNARGNVLGVMLHPLPIRRHFQRRLPLNQSVAWID